VEVDLRRCRVLKSGKVLDVSSKEFELLKYFICHAGETLSRDRLLEEVWGYENSPTTRTVDTTWCIFAKSSSPILNNRSTFSPCTEPAIASWDSKQSKSKRGGC
jgi:hypothetical protein